MMIIAAVVAITVGIGLTKYTRAPSVARTVRAEQELRTISFDIDRCFADTGACPETLQVVGHGKRIDPWGNPYMYLNFGKGTGSAAQFVLDNGLIDPAAVRVWTTSGGGSGGGSSVNTAGIGQAVQEPAPRPPSSDPKVIEEIKRKDEFLFPLNTDYDLLSLGPNKRGTPAIKEALSLDDVNTTGASEDGRAD